MVSTVSTYKNVLKADVAMGDVKRVQVVDSVQQLQHHAAHIRLRVAELISSHYSIVQVATLQPVSYTHLTLPTKRIV